MNKAPEGGQEKDPKVQPGSPVGDVVKVVLEPFAKGSISPPSMNLGPARDPNFYRVPCHIVRNASGKLLDKDRTLRAGPHKAHIAH